MIIDIENFTNAQIRDALCIAIRELGLWRENHGRGSGGGNFRAVGTVEGQYRVALTADRGVDQPPERDQ